MKLKKLLFQAYSETRLQNGLKVKRRARGILTNRKNVIHTAYYSSPNGKYHHRHRTKFKNGDNYQQFLISTIQRTIVRFFASGDDELTIYIYNPRHE